MNFSSPEKIDLRYRDEIFRVIEEQYSSVNNLSFLKTKIFFIIHN